ncbi:hypothetical protein V1520DRAFT_333927 [Lipomyces starkeyi]|uniref:Large ribosomal subunit protein mL50 n=1 Tax=Lipomyces starkeyi NRRL Y-11557 TaxID=675824 RepID=A0A1E3QDJ4_LIPST|nr:hypothetical protein LIPSTDRAFT_68383 [Lipomyces starkeyi NRRL Y-11557]
MVAATTSRSSMIAGRMQPLKLLPTFLSSSTAQSSANCLRGSASMCKNGGNLVNGGSAGSAPGIGERRAIQTESFRRHDSVDKGSAREASREMAGLAQAPRVIGPSQSWRYGGSVRGLHSSLNSTAWYDFMLGKNQVKKDVELSAEEIEELVAVKEQKKAESKKGEEDIGDDYRPLKLEDFEYRVSKIKPIIPKHVQNLDASGLVDGGIYEIGFKRATKSWKTKMNGFKIDIWKAKTPVHDKKQVLKIAKLVVADQLGLIKIDWPTSPAIELENNEITSEEDPFAKVVETYEPPSLDCDINKFSLRDINVRFQVVKRISQLTGRPIPDLVFTRALTMKEVLVYYAVDSHKKQSYGLFQDDPYNPYVTRLYIDPEKFEGTNVKIST